MTRSDSTTMFTVPPLSGDLWHNDCQISIQKEIGAGSSSRCYAVSVHNGDSDTIERPMILKEFCPNVKSFPKAEQEFFIQRDTDGELRFHFSPDDDIANSAVRKRRDAVKKAYDIQQRLCGINETMGIVVTPVMAWGDDERLTYYTLHNANWGNSLDEDPPADFYETMRVIYLAVDSVARMNAQGYVHGDLKPENLLWIDRGTDSSRVVLFDFDCSFDYKNKDIPDVPHGTAGYIAPELCKWMKSNCSLYGRPRLDVYALGCIMFRLLLDYRVTKADENSRSPQEAPFWNVFRSKCEHNWRMLLNTDEQKMLADILWRSIRWSGAPRASARYRTAGKLSEALHMLRTKLATRPRPIDDVSRSSYTMLSAGIISQYPLYDYMKPDSKIDVVLAGISPMRDAFLEHLVSSCQMLDREIHVHIIAPYIKDYLNEIVQKEFGKVVSIQLNGKEYVGENYFPDDTSIVNGKLAALDCWDKPVTIENLKAFSANYYLIVDTDTDANFRIAKELDEIRENPKDFFIGYTDSRGDGFNLRKPLFGHAAVIGCNENFSKSELSFQSDIVERAFQVHKRYSNPDKSDEALHQEFLDETAYNKSSSIRAALSLAYEAYSIGIDLREEGSAEAFEKALSEDKEKHDKLLWLEHRAWTGFMVMQGYQLPTYEQIKAYAFQSGNDQRDKKNKLHPCMCPSRAEGLQLSDKANPDWENNSHDAEYDPLDQFSLFFHRFCSSKVTEHQIRRYSDYLCLDDAETEEEVKFVNAVHTACESMLHGNNGAWDGLTFPEGLNEDLRNLFNVLKTKIKFLHEYNRFHDFKASDEDILNAVPDIFKK